MTSECSVVHLDVHLEVLVQVVGLQETDNGLCIHIILVLAGLHGFRLDEECTLESLSASIVASHGQHSCHVLLLTLLVGVQQTHVAFTSTPEYIVGTTQLDGSVNSVLDLNDSASYYVEVGVGRSTISIALVTEYVCGTPEQLDVGELLHLLLSVVSDSLHASLILLNGVTLFYEVNIVEAEVLDTQFIHDLEASIHLILSALNSVTCLVPLIRTGLTTELVCRSATQCVPPSHCELQPILHLLSHHDLLRLVVVESHYILTVLSFERNLTGKRKILFCHKFK